MIVSFLYKYLKINYFLLKKSLTSATLTISSLNAYAPVLSDFTMRMHFTLFLSCDLSPLKVATAFFAIVRKF